jgi:hypothetical protein
VIGGRKESARKDRSSTRPVTEKSNVILSRRKIVYLVVSIAIGAALVWLYDHFSQDKSSAHPHQEVKTAAPFTAAEQDPFLLPEITPARFRNTSKTVGLRRESRMPGMSSRPTQIVPDDDS